MGELPEASHARWPGCYLGGFRHAQGLRWLVCITLLLSSLASATPNAELGDAALAGMRKFVLHTKVNSAFSAHGINDRFVDELVRKPLVDAGLAPVEAADCHDDCSGVYLSVEGGPGKYEAGSIFLYHVFFYVSDDAVIRGHLVHVVFYQDQKWGAVNANDLKNYVQTTVQAQVNQLLGHWFATNKPIPGRVGNALVDPDRSVPKQPLNLVPTAQGRKAVNQALPPATTILLIYGGAAHKQFLGCLNCSEVDPNSVRNQFSEYGNKFSMNSLFNSFSEYGSQFSMYSACNAFATDPPVLVDRDGNYYGRLTVGATDAAQIPTVQAWIAGVCAANG